MRITDEVVQRMAALVSKDEEDVRLALEAGANSPRLVREWIAQNIVDDDEDEIDWDDDEDDDVDWEDDGEYVTPEPTTPAFFATLMTPNGEHRATVPEAGMALAEVLANMGYQFTSATNFHRSGTGTIDPSTFVLPGDVIYASKASGNGDH